MVEGPLNKLHCYTVCGMPSFEACDAQSSSRGALWTGYPDVYGTQAREGHTGPQTLVGPRGLCGPNSSARSLVHLPLLLARLTPTPPIPDMRALALLVTLDNLVLIAGPRSTVATCHSNVCFSINF